MTFSLLREELLDVPPTLTGNPGVDAPLTALLHGEPRRALDLLQGEPPTRTTAALTAWARQLDRNWYPGDVGAEVGLDPEGAFVQPQPTQDPVEYGTEILTAYGPTGLRTPRTLVELSMRMGAMPGVQQAVAQADQYLGWLSQYAQATGQPALVQWTFLAGADVHHRAGDNGYAALLQGARQQAQAMGDRPRLALTFLVEGDWAAAPGSSPEALGWDLAPQNVPSPLGVSDLPRAAAAWDQAEQLLQGFDLPRFRSALALRRAALARASGDVAAQAPAPRRRARRGRAGGRLRGIPPRGDAHCWSRTSTKGLLGQAPARPRRRVAPTHPRARSPTCSPGRPRSAAAAGAWGWADSSSGVVTRGSRLAAQHALASRISLRCN